MSNIFPPYVDPVLRSPLSDFVDGSGGRYLASTGDPCTNNRKYPVIGGIPRILVEGDNYTEAFGEQWLRWRRTQLDSHSGTSITRDRLFRCLGARGVAMLSGKEPVQVLEVGCGAGRFTEVLLQFPAARVTSLDLSSAVDANAKNFPPDERHRIVQADIMKPPLLPGSFDVVVCLGVVQHTPDSEATIAQLLTHVKSGGLLVIDHYKRSWKHWTKVTALLLRPILKRMPSKSRMRACEALVSVFFPIHKAIRKIPGAQQIVSRVSPILTYYHVFPELSHATQRQWAILDTHDSLTDWYKHLRSEEEIRTFLANTNSGGVEVWCGGNGVEARCIKVG